MLSKEVHKWLVSIPVRQFLRGNAQGEAVISSEESFFTYRPATGRITEHGHCLEGQSIAGKILGFPGGKGSSVVQADGLYKLEQSGMQPAGLIVQNLDTVLVSAAVIMEIPMVCEVPDSLCLALENGMTLKINTDENTIELPD